MRKIINLSFHFSMVNFTSKNSHLEQKINHPAVTIYNPFIQSIYVTGITAYITKCKIGYFMDDTTIPVIGFMIKCISESFNFKKYERECNNYI